MADVFDKNPTEYFDMNELFPVLNSKVGFNYEQLKKLVENSNFLKNNLGASDVRVGKVSINFVASGQENVEISSRKLIINNEFVIYLDFSLNLPSGAVSSVNGQTGEVVLTTETLGAIQKKIDENQYSFSEFNHTEEGVVFNKTKASVNPSGLPEYEYIKKVILNQDGLEFIDNSTSENYRPTVNGEEIAYLSDLEDSGGGFDLSMLPKYESKVLIDCSKRPALNGLVAFKIVSSSNFSIDWGDGSPIEVFETDTAQISHQYENTSFYGTITFYGNFNGLDAYNSSNYVNYVIIAVEYGENISSITNFRGCQNLISFKSKYKGGSLQLGSQAFYGCLKLVSFDCESIITRTDGQVFKSCAKLAFFPFDKLGEYCSFNGEIFYGCFTTKKSLELLLPIYNAYASSKAFASNTNLIDLKTNICYTQTYSGCTNLTNVELVDVGVGTNAFESCNNLKTIKMTQRSNETSIKAMSGSTGFGTNTNVETIFVRKDLLKSYKTGTNWVQYADKIYPHGGQYSETVTLPVANWVDNAQTVEVIGATAELRNDINIYLVDENGKKIKDTYGLTFTQGTMGMTFECETLPTEDIQVFVVSNLTNY